jgi:hypothetical protein
MPSRSSFEFLNAAASSQGTADPAGARDFLARFGYVPAQASGFGDVAAVAGAAPPSAPADVSDALRLYQRFHGLPITGQLDTATSAQMSQPRCGFPDILTLPPFALQGNKWTKSALTYRFENFSPDVSQQTTRAAVKTAFDLWAGVVPLTFTETDDADADLQIRFVAGEHGDGSSFDGAGRVLAHAFFPPPNGGDLAGDLHFDEAELWHVSLPIPSNRFDLITVAAHELGHSLGLQHSTINEALMFPSYTGPHRFLAADDVAGIQTLYGALT